MKYRIAAAFTAAFLCMACSPATFNITLDMRAPSKTGLSLGGKNISVSYLAGAGKRDSLFASGIAEGFAGAIEEDYFGGNEVIDIYKVSREPVADYSRKDAMIGLLVEQGSDAAFLFEVLSMGDISVSSAQKTASPASADSSHYAVASAPFAIRLYVYDAMNPADTVLIYNASSRAEATVRTNGRESSAVLHAKAEKAMADAGETIGRRSADIFLSTWEKTDFPIYYFESDEWFSAAKYASEYKWTEAMDKWISMLGTKNLLKKACLEYNLAAVNCILGYKDIALQWLDRSDSDYGLPESPALRRRIGKLR